MGPDEIPLLGQGTWPITDREACLDMVKAGLEAGYRHLDTAQMYDNEEHVGEALAAADVPREEVFVATKVQGENLAYEDVLASAEESREKLGVDAIDLLYVHFPRKRYDPEETLPAFDDLRDRGTIRRVGLSNYTPAYLDEALDVLESPLYAHQVEMHPLLHQADLHEYAVEHDHYLIAHTPLARGAVFEIDLLEAIAEKRGATIPQVTLAWLLSKENVGAIPKSTNPDHLRENFEARRLELDDEDVERIDAYREYRQRRVNNPPNPAWKWQLDG